MLFVGNVVTNCIDADTVEWHGVPAPRRSRRRSSSSATTRGSARCKLKLGPDGAIVRRRLLQPDHRALRGRPAPPRPRQARAAGSGGSSTRATPAKAPPPKMPDLSKRRPDELIAALGRPEPDGPPAGHQPLGRRRRGNEGGRAVAAWPPPAQATNPARRSPLLWVPAPPGRAGGRPLTSWPPTPDQLRPRPCHAHPGRHAAVGRPRSAAWPSRGLKDADPFVRRCAADALGLHPSRRERPAAAGPARATSRAPTTRTCCTGRGSPCGTSWPPRACCAALPLPGWTKEETPRCWTSCPAVTTPEAAVYVMKHLDAGNGPRGVHPRCSKHAARYAATRTWTAWPSSSRAKFGGDIDQQIELTSPSPKASPSAAQGRPRACASGARHWRHKSS